MFNEDFLIPHLYILVMHTAFYSIIRRDSIKRWIKMGDFVVVMLLPERKEIVVIITDTIEPLVDMI